jgi:predicted RND superfamily exporter protein
MFENPWIIILLVLVLVFFIALFFVADLILRDKKKAEPKKAETKPQEHVDAEDTREAELFALVDKNKVSELNQANLANDLERLIAENSKKEPQSSAPEQPYFRSRLDSNKIRARFEERHNYYALKHDQRAASSNISDVYDIDVSEDNSGVTLTLEDMKRLQALSELMKRKGDDDFFA